MKIGISLGTLHPSLWVEATREADRLGYESVWMPEHLVIPIAMTDSPHDGEDHPPIPANVPVFDALTYLGFLAGQTEQIHFGTQVYNIGLRHPFVVARAVATLDIISGGRLEFGIGASWLPRRMGGRRSRLRHPGQAGGRVHRRVPEALERQCR
jgi:alkanesulfonate monooxygenase SsuD/methylene tetrahydromethanopterin reductase-like flavin-dependent oxidoreductase (luciferase family)